MANYVNLLNLIYPVGTIIASYSSTSPADWVGGTWTTMDAFLYGATKNIGSTGGKDTHRHGLADTGFARIGVVNSDATSLGYSATTGYGTVTAYTVYGSSFSAHAVNVNNWTNLAGDTNNTTISLPYTNVYYYRRTA